ncbi:hypothetical protein ILUMI_21123, partial [Ignelater luminosus]
INQEAEQSTEPIIIQNSDINVNCSIVSPESSGEPCHALPSHNQEVQKSAIATCVAETSLLVNNGNPDLNIENRISDVKKKRKIAHCNLEKQAAKMLNSLNSEYPSAKVGDTVRVRVPDVDRAGSDQRNLLTTVTEIT